MTLPKSFNFDRFYEEVAIYIRRARNIVVKTTYYEMIHAYWHIGRRIVEVEQQGGERAEYGAKLLESLSKKLSDEFGRGFALSTLKSIRQFYLTYRDRISSEARSQSEALDFNPDLSWTHYRLLMRESRQEVRDFYEIEAAKNNWSTPELERQMGSLLFERLAKSRDKKGLLELAQEGQIIRRPEDALKDPVVLEFLDIPESHRLVESKLEEALITHLQQFLLELGQGFAFVARQKRLTLEGDHFYADLVFYHTILKCYVVIDIKTHALTHADIGQMQLYVNYYDQECRSEDDNPTVGLILCTQKNETMARYTLGQKANQIFASKYQFHLPTEDELAKELKRELKDIKQSLKYESHMDGYKPDR